MLLRLCCFVGFFMCMVDGHGALVSPRSRNSADFMLIKPNDRTGSPCQNVTGAACNNGQAAFWYSQGCFIGCKECDHESGRRQTDLCGSGATGSKMINNDPTKRSLNRNATAGSIYDIYRHNPWRWPGNAPVGDACGFAGGTPWGADAPEEGVFVNTTYAHHGMKGSTLSPLETGVVWKAGGEAEVTWQLRYNHGGGYAYRLCPLESPLTEECFQSNPLDFDRDKQALVFSDGSRRSVTGTFVDEGTSPVGSTWSMVPIPPTGQGPRCICSPDVNYKPANFDCGCKMGEQVDSCHSPGNCSSGQCLPCPETPGSDCSRCDNYGGGATFPPPCTDCKWESAAILDVVKIPATLKPGKYVLGFRYDCEATSQVWSSCADITIE